MNSFSINIDFDCLAEDTVVCGVGLGRIGAVKETLKVDELTALTEWRSRISGERTGKLRREMGIMNSLPFYGYSFLSYSSMWVKLRRIWVNV